MSDGPDIQAVLIVVLVAAIVGFVGLQVMTEEVTQEELNEFEQQEQNITEGCMGVAGCGNGWGLLPPLGITAVLAVILGNVIAYVNSPDDDLQEIKQLYAEGDIDLLELEERLDDEIDDNEQ